LKGHSRGIFEIVLAMFMDLGDVFASNGAPLIRLNLEEFVDMMRILCESHLQLTLLLEMVLSIFDFIFARFNLRLAFLHGRY
jgi:hypothetical protein